MRCSRKEPGIQLWPHFTESDLQSLFFDFRYCHHLVQLLKQSSGPFCIISESCFCDEAFTTSWSILLLDFVTVRRCMYYRAKVCPLTTSVTGSVSLEELVAFMKWSGKSLGLVLGSLGTKVHSAMY